MSDKYDCSASLRYPVKSWLEVNNTTEPDRAWKLMGAAYYFDNGVAFKKISAQLGTSFRESYLKFTKLRVFRDSDVLLRICGKCRDYVQFERS
jgi:hypothetical protein